jgi:hypothetical protein
MGHYICFSQNRSLLALRGAEACFPRSRLESGYDVPHKPMGEVTCRRIGIIYYEHSVAAGLAACRLMSSTMSTRLFASLGTPSIVSVGLTSLPSQVKRSGMFPPSLKSGLLSFIACSDGIFALPVLVIRVSASIGTGSRVFIGPRILQSHDFFGAHKACSPFRDLILFQGKGKCLRRHQNCLSRQTLRTIQE